MGEELRLASPEEPIPATTTLRAKVLKTALAKVTVIKEKAPKVKTVKEKEPKKKELKEKPSDDKSPDEKVPKKQAAPEKDIQIKDENQKESSGEKIQADLRTASEQSLQKGSERSSDDLAAGEIKETSKTTGKNRGSCKAEYHKTGNQKNQGMPTNMMPISGMSPNMTISVMLKHDTYNMIHHRKPGTGKSLRKRQL